MIKNNICPVCNDEFHKLSQHISSRHKEFAQKQQEEIIYLFSSGMSAEEIANLPHIMYAGKSGIIKIIAKYMSKDDIEKHRRVNISSTLTDNYASGQYDWINQLNSQRNKTDEARQKNSNGVRRAYDEGRKTAWMKGKTKSSDLKIRQSADKIAKTLSSKFAEGKLLTVFKSVDQNPSWKVDRSTVSNYWRKNFDFQKNDKAKLLTKFLYRCADCKISISSLNEEREVTKSSRLMLEYDHIIPISKGGIRDIDKNGQVLCSRCHIIKTLHERTDSEDKKSAINNRFNLNPVLYLNHKFGGSIDYDQLLWTSPKESQQLSIFVHPLTKEYCNEKFLLRTFKNTNVKTCIFFADEWNAKREIALSMINNRLKLNQNKIGARECSLVEISHEESAVFMNTNHIAGNAKAAYSFALKYNEQIVSVLTFRKPFTKRNNNTIEIARFASLLNTNVIGGFNKLLKSSIKKLKNDGFETILTYADLRFGSGNVYGNAGFNLIGKTDLDYFYTDGFQRFGRMKFCAKDGISEREIANNAGVYRVYGCGFNIYELSI